MNIEELEKLRKKARNKIIIGILISVAISIAIYIFFKSVIAYFIFIISIIITIVITRGPVRKFTLAFKDTFVLKSLNNVFTNLAYHPEKGLNKEIIANTGMMDMGDRYSSNDLISAKYKNISVQQADVHIEEERETRDKDGNTHTYYVTLFKGRWMVFDFNKEFKANIQVRSKNFLNARANTFLGKSKYNKVAMEDQEFNKMFRIFAQDDHDAFYILTPHLMEKIKKLSESVKSPLLFCFVDNKLHIGIENGKDSFEHSVFKKINEEEEKNKISSEIKEITNFVDELDLDNDLFRKEA